MRVNLIIHSLTPAYSTMGAIPLSLTIRPSCGVPGEYSYPTDSKSLLSLLSRKTSLPESVLRRFLGDLYASSKARLLGVELSDQVLTDMGYFID